MRVAMDELVRSTYVTLLLQSRIDPSVSIWRGSQATRLKISVRGLDQLAHCTFRFHITIVIHMVSNFFFHWNCSECSRFDNLS